MRVLPMVGAGPVRFGMTREEVMNLLGEPDERETEGWPRTDSDSGGA